jgi:hypothetical protein
MARIVLAVDVGGSHVKALLSSGGERRRFDSGSDLTPVSNRRSSFFGNELRGLLMGAT